MKLTNTPIIAGTSNIYFQCPSCQTKALVDVDNEVRRLLDIDYQDRFVCEECGEEFLGEVGYDLKPKFTKIADNVESATNTCGIAARPDQLKKLEDEVVSAAKNYGGAYDIDPESYFTRIDSSSTRDDDYYEYSFMVGDQLEWSGLLGGQYQGVVTDVNDEYVTVDVMWTDKNTGDTVTDTQKFEISTDPEGRECIIVWTYGSDAGYVYPPSNDYINSATGANYGGAYDIDPESYFTREDLDELGYSVAELVSLDIGDTVEYAGAWIEPNNELTVDLKFSDYDSSVTLKVDMRKIRRPEYLIVRYAERIADESAAQIQEVMNAEERIESSTAINAGYWDEPEDDWIEVDDVTDVVEVDIDGTQITVTADGEYDWTEQEHDWAKDNEIDIPELGTWIALDEYRVEDDVWEMISDMLPEPQSEDRTYTVDGTIRLCYTVSGMLARADGSVREPDDDFGWGYQTMADAVDIEFNYEKSDVVSFHVE